jgi:hypothetical protein
MSILLSIGAVALGTGAGYALGGKNRLIGASVGLGAGILLAIFLPADIGSGGSGGDGSGAGDGTGTGTMIGVSAGGVTSDGAIEILIDPRGDRL